MHAYLKGRKNGCYFRCGRAFVKRTIVMCGFSWNFSFALCGSSSKFIKSWILKSNPVISSATSSTLHFPSPSPFGCFFSSGFRATAPSSPLFVFRVSSDSVASVFSFFNGTIATAIWSKRGVLPAKYSSTSQEHEGKSCDDSNAMRRREVMRHAAIYILESTHRFIVEYVAKGLPKCYHP